MKQFTVYASDETGGGSAVYMVTFLRDGALAYPLREGWHAISERVESGINRTRLHETVQDPFAKLMDRKDSASDRKAPFTT